MLAAKARALHSAGLADAAALAAAPERQVRRALARGLPRALAGGAQPRQGSAQPRKGGAGSAAARATLSGGAAACMAVRSARAFQAGVHCSIGPTAASGSSCSAAPRLAVVSAWRQWDSLDWHAPGSACIDHYMLSAVCVRCERRQIA